MMIILKHVITYVIFFLQKFIESAVKNYFIKFNVFLRQWLIYKLLEAPTCFNKNHFSIFLAYIHHTMFKSYFV